jgi:hypothetical protein
MIGYLAEIIRAANAALNGFGNALRKTTEWFVT